MAPATQPIQNPQIEPARLFGQTHRKRLVPQARHSKRPRPWGRSRADRKKGRVNAGRAVDPICRRGIDDACRIIASGVAGVVIYLRPMNAKNQTYVDQSMGQGANRVPLDTGAGRINSLA